MSSINTNLAAMTALQSLTATNKNLVETQSRISTGFRVAEAADNAAYWSIATTMRSDKAALSTVQDALGLGASVVDVAYTAMNAAIGVVDEIKSKLVAAREPGVDKSKVQSEIGELQKQLTGIAKSAAFSGENWLNVDSSASGFNAAS
jgi:flagellin